jgi:hypothetical protein
LAKVKGLQGVVFIIERPEEGATVERTRAIIPTKASALLPVGWRGGEPLLVLFFSRNLWFAGMALQAAKKKENYGKKS